MIRSGGQACLVDVAVEAHSCQASKDGADEGCGGGGEEGDDAADGEGAFVDGDAGKGVERAQDVVLAAGDHAEDGDDDGDRDGPQPDGDALLGTVESGHASGDVPAAVVGHEQDDQ